MARRTSRRRRSTRRRSRRSSRRRRSTRRNTKRWVVANRRRRRSRRRVTGNRHRRRMTGNRRRRRVRRNQGFLAGITGTKWGPEVIMPVLGGTVGFIGARYLGNMVAMRDWGTVDPKIGKLIAAGVGIPATFALSRWMPGGMLSKNSGAIVLGMGLAAAEAWLRDTPLLGGSPAAAAVLAPGNGNGNGIQPGAPIPMVDLPGEVDVVDSGDGTAGIGAYYETAMTGLADYYTEGMLGGLGADPADQSRVESTMNRMEAVSTIIPTDTAMRASTMPQVAPVHERFANRGDRGHAGGMFARHLFSGMMGS